MIVYLQVVHHQKLGQSKEEFLQLNGPHMAAATFVLVVMTNPASASPFVFHEVCICDIYLYIIKIIISVNDEKDGRPLKH